MQCLIFCWLSKHLIDLSYSLEFFSLKDGVWKVVRLLVSSLENQSTEQYSTILYSRVHELWCSVFQYFNIAHFNTTVSTCCDRCWWTRMSPRAWQVSFPHCLTVLQITVSSVVLLSFIKWSCVLLFYYWCFIHSWKQIDIVHWRWIAVLSETEGNSCSVACQILVYRVCCQSTACLNTWAVSLVCLELVFFSAFALWLFSCTCCVRHYFPAHAALDNILLHMLC